MSRPVTATIHTDAMRRNLVAIRARAPGCRVMAMVKADAYGHGLETAAAALRDADAFGVATLDVRSGSATGKTNGSVVSGFEYPPRTDSCGPHADGLVHHPAQLELLEQSDGEPVRCWLKIDTGMHRLGFAPETVRQAHARLMSARSVADEVGLMSHFASSDEFEGISTNDRQTRAQMQVFADATSGLTGPRSMANSAAILGWPAAHGDWVRPGGALYGMLVVAGKVGADFGLQPAMTFATRLLAVNIVRKGEHIGYSATWQTPEDMRVGVAAVGYGDGYPRAPAGTPVLVNGTWRSGRRVRWT